MIIGIDVGGSTTKIVGVKDGEIRNPMFVTAKDPVTSLFGAFGKYIYDHSIQLSEVEQVMLTGVGSSYIQQPLYGLPTARTDEFIANGLKFVFPAKPSAPERGVPTGFSAPMLEGQLISVGQDIYVWAYAEGRVRGLSIEPLFKSVPEAVQKDERLYEYLALVDAIRLGKQRESNLAVERLKQRILNK